MAVDSDIDGTTDTLVTWFYDAEGRSIAEDIDNGADGSIDARFPRIGGGNTLRIDHDEGADDSIDFDKDGDNIADNVLNVVREASGMVIRLNEYFGNVGGVDFTRILTYEAGACDADDVANIAAPIVIDICL